MLAMLGKTTREEKREEQTMQMRHCEQVMYFHIESIFILLSLSHSRKGCYTTSKFRRVPRQDNQVERDCVEWVSSAMTTISEVNYKRYLQYQEQLGEHKNRNDIASHDTKLRTISINQQVKGSKQRKIYPSKSTLFKQSTH